MVPRFIRPLHILCKGFFDLKCTLEIYLGNPHIKSVQEYIKKMGVLITMMNLIDERVEQAIYILWVNFEYKRANEAKALLEQAANEGVADAYYFLARLYAGSCYVDSHFKFEEDMDKCHEYLNLSIENGSAIGMFAARRFGYFYPRGGKMICEPYHSTQEIWDAVCCLAENGEIFSQYLLANAYYYGDVIELLNIDVSGFTEEQMNAQIRVWLEKACVMYEDLIAKGLMMGVYNYIDIITSGDYGFPKNQKRADEVEMIYKKRTSKGIMKLLYNIFG